MTGAIGAFSRARIDPSGGEGSWTVRGVVIDSASRQMLDLARSVLTELDAEVVLDKVLVS